MSSSHVFILDHDGMGRNLHFDTVIVLAPALQALATNGLLRSVKLR